MRILVVEDAEKLARALKTGLEAEGYAVDVLHDGGAARRRFAARRGAPTASGAEDQLPYDLLILDVMLPGVDGFTLCRELRDRGLTVPVLMLTARDATADKVTGLDSGADDYLVKPFAFEELLARIRTLLRRPRRALPPVLALGALTLDPATRVAQLCGEPLALSPKEFSLLRALPAAPGRGAEPRLDPRPRLGRRVRLVLQHRRRLRRPAAAQAGPAGRRRAARDRARRRLRAARGRVGPGGGGRWLTPPAPTSSRAPAAGSRCSSRRSSSCWSSSPASFMYLTVRADIRAAASGAYQDSESEQAFVSRSLGSLRWQLVAVDAVIVDRRRRSEACCTRAARCVRSVRAWPPRSGSSPTPRTTCALRWPS